MVFQIILIINNAVPVPEQELDDGLWHDDAYFPEDDGLWHDDAYFTGDDGLWYDESYF